MIRLDTLAELPDGTTVPRTLGTCEHCGCRFLGRADARYCSDRCRVASARKRDAVQEAKS